MPDTSRDPVDHARTTRQHAGETMKNTRNAPGLLAVALGVIALVIGLFALASDYTTTATVALVIAAVVGVAGLVWLALTHRQVRAREVQWHARNEPDEPLEPPTS